MGKEFLHLTTQILTRLYIVNYKLLIKGLSKPPHYLTLPSVITQKLTVLR